MKDTKFSRFILEAGKIFVAIVTFMIPIIYADAFTLNWHVGLKIGMFVLLMADYIFLFHIIDKACDVSDKVNINNKKDTKENIKEEENHQMTIDEFLEEKDKEYEK